jgi:uncharacterized membrane protein
MSRAPITRVRARVDIDAPPGVVFSFFDDLANAPVLVPGLVEVVSVEPRPDGGRHVSYTIRARDGSLVDASSEHLEHRPPERTVTRGVQSGVETRSIREFLPLADGRTRVVTTVEWSVPIRYVGALVTAPLRGPLRRSIRAAHAAARERLES